MLILAAAAVIAAAPPEVPPRPASSCPRTTSHLAGDDILFGSKSLPLQKLTELPDANLYLTVFRRVDGCEAPIVVKYGVNRR
jgi:hypothetical protein